MSLQPLAAPTTKLVDKVKNRVQAVERRSLVIEPQWTARSQNISINLILKSEMKGNIDIYKIDIFHQYSPRVPQNRGVGEQFQEDDFFTVH